MSNKLVCIHGHFYQPPRENPWLEAVEVEDSAAPYHDWNERVSSECYAANAFARLLEQDTIAELINTYEFISFDFGPTLLSWLEDSDPQTYESVIEADRRSVKARTGHGNALAQAYNHMILPLASPRDKLTQTRWGITDFVHRFGRQPEGMWLPETAVDTDSLEVLAQEGIRFVLLAPHQAQTIRPLENPQEEWQKIGESDSGVDTTQPYLCRLPSGREIVVFFYDGAASQGVAFGGLLDDGSAFTKRLLSGFGKQVNRPQLVHIATDGESYGHHHRYGEMALAFALSQLHRGDDVSLTNYGEFLDHLSPTHEVTIVENSSWSCAHGVGRWSADCGCRISGGSQAWRRPLREALDWLRDELDIFYESKAEELLRDPWLARDEYIKVILCRSAEKTDAFLDEHSTRRLEHFDRVDALSLLEMQRHRMLMFTSCGWFFDDCAGLETVQILKYAARAIQLASGFGATGLEDRFTYRLKPMRSNNPSAPPDGKAIYNALVRPTMVDLRRVVSHHAITRLFEKNHNVLAKRTLYSYKLKDLGWNSVSSAGTRLAVGRVRVQSLITHAIEDVSYGLLHFGGHDFNCSIRGAVTVEGYDAMRRHILDTYENRSLTEVIHAFDQYFEGRHYGLEDLFLEGRRSVLTTVTQNVLSDLEKTVEIFYDEQRKLFDMLRDAGFPLPDAFTRIVAFALERRIVSEFEKLASAARDPETSIEKLEELTSEVIRRGVKMSQASLGAPLTAAIDAVAEQLVPKWSSSDLKALSRILAIGRMLKVEPKLWDVQNALLSELQQKPPRGKERRKEVEALLEEFGISAKVMMRRRRNQNFPSRV